MLHSYCSCTPAGRSKGFSRRIRPARWHIGAWRWTTSATPWRSPRPGPSRRRLGRTRKARAVGAKTQRDRDWIEALSAYFRDHDKVAVDARMVAYNPRWSGWRNAIRRLRGAGLLCADAASLGAEKRPHLCQPAQIRGDSGEAFDQNPQHPGVTHYLIHTFDFAPLAERELRRAALCRIAPAVPTHAHAVAHLLHGRTLGGIDRRERVGA